MRAGEGIGVRPPAGRGEAVGSAWRARLLPRLPALVAVLAFAVFLVLFWRDRPAYDALLRAAGIPVVELPGTPHGQGGQPFFDTRFVLAQLQCWRRGIDVYAVNPCDPIGRLQDYSPLWLRLGFLPDGAGAVAPLGLALDLMFLASLFLLPPPAPRPAEIAVLSLAMVSSATIFAMERGNTDLLVFAMCVVAGRLLAAAPWARAAGYGVILAAAALKFYPLAALAAALRERLRGLLAVCAVTAAAVAAFAWQFGAETQRALANTADSYFGLMWGAAGLPFGAGEILARMAPGRAMHALPPLLLAGLLLMAAVLAVRLARHAGFAAACAALPPPVACMLLLGAALVAGCFLTHQNISYRTVLLILELPGLLALARAVRRSAARIVLWMAVLGAVFLLWNPPGLLSSLAPFGWLVRQYLWWAHVTVSLAVLLCFGLESDAWRWLRRAGKPSPATAG